MGEVWLVAPHQGDCTDYAVTKRHELLARGWSSHSLLLTEVVVASGEHHLVLVVRTSEGDFVLDNLNAHVRPISQITYGESARSRLKIRSSGQKSMLCEQIVWR